MQPAVSPPDAGFFRTPDLGVASFLLGRGFELVSLEQPGGRKVFVFVADAGPVAAEFYRGGTVSARALLNAWRDLRALLRNR